MKTITVDNFFEDPDEIRKFALKQTYKRRDPEGHFEGVRSEPIVDLDFDLHVHLCKQIVKEIYGFYPSGCSADTRFHITQEKDMLDEKWINSRPHKDYGLYTAIIFLTPNAPIESGTTLYTEDKEVDISLGNVYNRLIAYPAEYWHSATSFFGDSHENSRLCILFFLDEVKP